MGHRTSGTNKISNKRVDLISDISVIWSNLAKISIKIKDNIEYNELAKTTKSSYMLFNVGYIKVENKEMEDNFAYTNQRRLVLS